MQYFDNESQTVLFKIRVLELLNQRTQQRIELKKQVLQIMQENPELRDVLAEELRNLRQEEEADIKMIALEFQSKPAIEGGNQPAGLQITN